MDRSAGIDVRVGGRGRTIRADLRSTKSSIPSSSFVTGSVPFSNMNASMRRFSNIFPKMSVIEGGSIAVTYHFSWKLQALVEILQKLQGVSIGA